MKILRYLIFIPIVIGILLLVYIGLPLLLFQIMSLSKFWIVFLLLAFSGIIFSIYTFLPLGISWLSSKISPSSKFSFYLITALSLILCIVQTNWYWTMPGGNEFLLGAFFPTFLTSITAAITFSLWIGASTEILEEKSWYLKYLVPLGSITIPIATLFTLCLFATKICHIKPDKMYSWYSGIWHGLFIIPNWVLSWFSDEVFCKAPKHTGFYSVWWWIIFIFSILSALSRRRGE